LHHHHADVVDAESAYIIVILAACRYFYH